MGKAGGASSLCHPVCLWGMVSLFVRLSSELHFKRVERLRIQLGAISSNICCPPRVSMYSTRFNVNLAAWYFLSQSEHMWSLYAKPPHFSPGHGTCRFFWVRCSFIFLVLVLFPPPPDDRCPKVPGIWNCSWSVGWKQKLGVTKIK